MKRKFLIVLLLMISVFSCAGALSACSFSELRFNEIKDNNGTVVGYSVDSSVFYNPKTISIPAKHLGKPVTKIERSAFGHCTKAESVYIPDTITEIGDNAFFRCDRIKNVYITDLSAWCNISFGWNAEPMREGANLYLNNKLVTDLIIPDGVTAIRAGVFEKFGSITSVTLPESVNRIGGSAFVNCQNLKTVTLNNGLNSINSYAFAWCERLEEIVIPEGVTGIGESAFFSCSGLLSVTIPSSIETIHQFAFKYCERLAVVYNYSDFNIVKGSSEYEYGGLGKYAINVFTSKDEESTITETDDGYVFYSDADNNYLVNYTGDATKITLPSTSTVGQYEIGKYAFYERKITEVTIPDGVTGIGISAFEKCEGLKKVAISDSVTQIGSFAFCGCESLTEITIPYGVSILNWGIFQKCENLKNISIPSTVTEIGTNAFWGCSSIQTIEIPKGTTTLYDGAFGKCTNLKQVIMPDSIKSIYSNAFKDSSIDSIIYKGTVEQWNSIYKEAHWDSVTKGFTVYCTDGEL